MSENNTNVPKIRFPGFTDAWEQRRLGEVAEIVGGGTPSTSNNDYWDGDIDWYSPAEIGEQIYVKGSRKKITKLGLLKSSARILPVGTVLFTSRAGIGNTAILAKEGSTNQGFQSIVPHQDKLDSYFIFSRTPELKSYGETNGAGSTFVEVSGKQMGKMPILIPRMEEQQKIGVFFNQLDHLITLHQRKLNHLQEKKKSLLQKMFPKDGADIPEVRFPGFTDAWEQQKMSSVKDVRDGTHDSPKYHNVGHPLVTSKNLTEYGLDMTDVSLISDEDFNAINQRSKVDVGDIIFGMIGTIGNPVILKRDDFAIKNVALIKRDGKVENEFLIQLLKSPVFDRYIKKQNAGGTQKFLGLSQIRNFEFLVPSKAEQEKIGNFFEQLDHLITLHQRKLTHLQEQKKALLQQMFV